MTGRSGLMTGFLNFMMLSCYPYVLPQKKKKASIFSSLPNFTRAGKETFISKIPLTDKTQLLLLQLIKTLSRILLWDFFVFFFLKTLESEFLEAVFFFEDYE